MRAVRADRGLILCKVTLSTQACALSPRVFLGFRTTQTAYSKRRLWGPHLNLWDQNFQKGGL